MHMWEKFETLPGLDIGWLKHGSDVKSAGERKHSMNMCALCVSVFVLRIVLPNANNAVQIEQKLWEKQNEADEFVKRTWSEFLIYGIYTRASCMYYYFIFRLSHLLSLPVALHYCRATHRQWRAFCIYRRIFVLTRTTGPVFNSVSYCFSECLTLKRVRSSFQRWYDTTKWRGAIYISVMIVFDASVYRQIHIYVLFGIRDQQMRYD